MTVLSFIVLDTEQCMQDAAVPYVDSGRFYQHLFQRPSVLRKRASDGQLVQRCRKLLEIADIRINSTRSWDIRINHHHFFRRIVTEGSLGLGESYMDGWWDCPALDQLFYKVLRARLNSCVLTWSDALTAIQANFLNPQKISRAFQIGEHHYDLDNELYQTMLDK